MRREKKNKNKKRKQRRQVPPKQATYIKEETKPRYEAENCTSKDQ